ncbi:MAG: hypothetical protein R8K20_10405 [Gallionellaceae bacterium]
MLESLTIITLITLYLVFFRPGKTPALNNPLIIHRPGQYHMTLAPQLNLAQPFIEDLAKQIGSPSELAANSATLCFEVKDKDATAHGKNFYLLAITQRNGLLYFQVTSSKSDDKSAHAEEILAFANNVLVSSPMSGEIDSDLNTHLIAMAHEAAKKRGNTISDL